MKAEIIISPTNPEYEDLKANVYFQNAIKGDKGDKGDVYFASFDVDVQSGYLNMNTPDQYSGPTFEIVDSILQVEV